MEIADRLAALTALHAREAMAAAGGATAWTERKSAAYGGLTPDEAAALATAALALPDERLRDDVLVHLACHRPGALAGVQPELARSGCAYPGLLYAGAGAEARDTLLARLARADTGTLAVNHALTCLAWIDDATVQARFAEWRAKPPAWAASLHVPPHRYALEAGWELTPAGGRRELCAPASTLLGIVDADAAADLVVVPDLEQRSPWLDRPLTRIALTRPRIELVTCDQSTCFAPIFCTIDGDGRAAWSDHNRRPDYLGGGEVWPTLPPTRLLEHPTPLTPFWGHWQVWEEIGCKLGGFPSWLQHATYPLCPGCERHLPFLGQLDGGQLDSSEGLLYLFHCADCRLGATVYQQT